MRQDAAAIDIASHEAVLTEKSEWPQVRFFAKFIDFQFNSGP
jgi:hypothetical protein